MNLMCLEYSGSEIWNFIFKDVPQLVKMYVNVTDIGGVFTQLAKDLPRLESMTVVMTSAKNPTALWAPVLEAQQNPHRSSNNHLLEWVAFLCWFICTGSNEALFDKTNLNPAHTIQLASRVVEEFIKAPISLSALFSPSFQVPTAHTSSAVCISRKSPLNG
ncbi:hypothetical protein L1049_012219 [Liquidambar formosana]|uniref:Uncharacterized protein n=1 Tax=Liquidambar formosana TaxID=63359 RepID=A0AAP0X0D5_LIQFO